MWIGLLVGIVVGAALWKLEGAIVLGFFGWIVGVIIDSRKRGKSQPVASTTTATQTVSLQSRVARLEITVEQLQKRLAHLESGEVPLPTVTEEPPSEHVTEPMAQPVVAEPTPIPEPIAAEPPPPP